MIAAISGDMDLKGDPPPLPSPLISRDGFDHFKIKLKICDRESTDEDGRGFRSLCQPAAFDSTKNDDRDVDLTCLSCFACACVRGRGRGVKGWTESGADGLC